MKISVDDLPPSSKYVLILLNDLRYVETAHDMTYLEWFTILKKYLYYGFATKDSDFGMNVMIGDAMDELLPYMLGEEK